MLRTKRFALTLHASVLFCALTLAGTALANRAVSIAPTRVILDERTRTATVYLNNRGSQSATYRISIVNRRMLENGHIVPADEVLPDERFASEFVRFSPRRVVVPAQGSQAVRLTMCLPRGREIPDGEYRSHLMFRAVPDLPDPTAQDEEPEGIRVTAVAIIETTIPVIVRKGDPQAEIRFGEPELTLDGPDDKTLLSVPLIRTGERSVYGDLQVWYEDERGRRDEVLLMRGMAVYHPTPQRVLQLPIELPETFALAGRLHVSYAETAESKGEESTELTVPLR